MVSEGVELDRVSYADVRDSIRIARSHGERFFAEIVWQVEHETWKILGYRSWDEMRDAEYADMGVVAPRSDRPELQARLRKHLTQEETAETLGVSQRTIERGDSNRQTSVSDDESTITNSRGQSRPSSYNRQPIDHEARADAAVDRYPDLAYYRDTATKQGDYEDVWRTAAKLDEFAERGELDERLENLRRSVDYDRKRRNGTLPKPEPPRTCPTCGQPIRS